MYKSQMLGLQAAEKHQNYNDQQNRAYTARWGVPPVAAVRPTWKDSKQRHYQEND
jgi:hypothetical protein